MQTETIAPALPALSRADLMKATALDGQEPVTIIDRSMEESHGIVGVLRVGAQPTPFLVRYVYLHTLRLITD